MKRPTGNILALAGSDGAIRIIGFFITVYLARVLGPSAFGLVSVGLSVLGILLVLASPGFQILETRNAAAFDGVDRTRVETVISLRLVLALLFGSMLWLVLMVTNVESPSSSVILLFAVSLVPLALTPDWFFQGKEDFFSVGIARVLSYVVYGVIIVITVQSYAEVLMAPVAFAVGNLAAMGYLVSLYVARYGGIRFRGDRSAWKNVLKENIPVGLATFLGQNVLHLPPIVIGILLGAAEAGWFSAAMKLLFVILIIDRVFNALVLPIMTRQFSVAGGDPARLVTIALKLLSVIVIPVAVCGFVFADQVVTLVFGGEYPDSIALVRVLTGYFVGTLFNSLLVAILVGAKREREYVRAMVISTPVFAVILIAFTMAFGVVGSAWGVVIGEAITLALLGIAAGRVVNFPAVSLFVRPVIGFGVMLVSHVFLVEIGVVLSTSIALAGFASVVFLTGMFSKDEFRYLKERFV